jgi:hypothetical protein
MLTTRGASPLGLWIVAVHVEADSSAASRGVVVCMMVMFRGESND